ncbi:MAG: hypothetical protein LUQ71_06790 [Methanoregula sp.]|nr:hypothetical protein [Methanoregula sp.]
MIDIRDRQVAFRAGACLVVLMLLVPFVSATVDSDTIPKSQTPNQADRPETIASLKMHTAYVGEDQDVRMSGTIQYINNISRGAGTTTLQEIRDDYLVTASSIPLMGTSAEIIKARENLRILTQRFSEETRARMVQFNGTKGDMRASLQSYQNATANALSGNESIHWLANESARLTLFNRDSTKRMLQIKDLGKQGINTTLAKNLSEQIDAQRPVLQKVLTNKSAEALATTNTAIKALTLEFRKNVASSRAALVIEMKRDAMMAMN